MDPEVKILFDSTDPIDRTDKEYKIADFHIGKGWTIKCLTLVDQLIFKWMTNHCRSGAVINLCTENISTFRH